MENTEALTIAFKNASDEFEQTRPDERLYSDFIRSMYSCFRISNNIVDQRRSTTSDVDMMIHVVFVLLLPFLFFNCIIAAVSSELSFLTEAWEEIHILIEYNFSLWFYIMFHRQFLKKMLRFYLSFNYHGLLTTTREGSSDNGKLLTFFAYHVCINILYKPGNENLCFTD